MEKIILFIFACIFSISIDAQGLYKSVVNYDKFDDVISEKTIKTLIELDRNKHKITIETKGSEPKVYIYLFDPESTGTKENPVNLTGNLWGYQEEFGCIPLEKAEALIKEIEERASEIKGNEALVRKLFEKYELANIVLRTIVNQYTHDYISKVAWIQYVDKTRTIYHE